VVAGKISASRIRKRIRELDQRIELVEPLKAERDQLRRILQMHKVRGYVAVSQIDIPIYVSPEDFVEEFGG
jgi:hypothetical protein